MQVVDVSQAYETECIHKFILVGNEEVCELCGRAQPYECIIPKKSRFVYHYNTYTPVPGKFNNLQHRYIDNAFMRTGTKRVQRLVTLFTKELGITHPILQLDIINLYNKPSNTRTTAGKNLALTIAAYMYICAQRLGITLTIAQLTDVLLKYDIDHGIHRAMREDKKRFIKTLISGAVRQCVVKNDLYFKRNEEIHDVIIQISQVGAQKGYDPLIVRQAIFLTNQLLEHDPNVFAGLKPSLNAALMVYIAAGGKIRYKNSRGKIIWIKWKQKPLSRDFRTTSQQMPVRLKRLIELLDMYGIERPALP
jgi:hypothetical protein